VIPTRLTALLKIDLPVLSAAMGGVATPALAAAVSEAGGAGSIGLFQLPPAACASAVTDLARLTNRTFGIGLIPEIQTPSQGLAQLDAALGAAPDRAFIQFYGLPDAAMLRRVQSSGRRFIVQVGTSDDARMALHQGCDALILQGIEAGGHLLGDRPLAELLASVEAFTARTPLIAAGGVASGADLYRVLTHGFDGALCGTLFASAREANAHPDYQQRIVEADGPSTLRSRAFEFGWPGREHRVLRNSVAETAFGTLPRTTIGHTVVAGRRLPVWRYSAAVPTRDTQGDIANMALYCGESCARIAAVRPANEILESLERDFWQIEGGCARSVSAARSG